MAHASVKDRHQTAARNLDRADRTEPMRSGSSLRILQHTKQRKRFQNHSGNAFRCAFEQVRADPCSTGSHTRIRRAEHRRRSWGHTNVDGGIGIRPVPKVTYRTSRFPMVARLPILSPRMRGCGAMQFSTCAVIHSAGPRCNPPQRAVGLNPGEWERQFRRNVNEPGKCHSRFPQTTSREQVNRNVFEIGSRRLALRHSVC